MFMRALLAATLLTAASAHAIVAEPADPAQAIAQKFSEASDPKPDRPSLDYEMDMLRRARAEKLERNAAAAKTTATTSPSAEPQSGAEARKPAPQSALPAMTAAPLTTRLSPSTKPPAKTAFTPTPPPTSLAAADDLERKPVPEAHATVLLVLDTEDRDPQAHFKPDPIVCFDQRCWISNGLDAPARPMPRSEAVALKSTESAARDSCSGKSACVFRNIALNPDAQIQVVEVGESRGVADGAYTVGADATCRKQGGALVCDNALVTHAFRLWVVPEAIAQEIGAATLEDAIAEGLPDNHAEQSNDK